MCLKDTDMVQNCQVAKSRFILSLVNHFYHNNSVVVVDTTVYLTKKKLCLLVSNALSVKKSPLQNNFPSACFQHGYLFLVYKSYQYWQEFKSRAHSSFFLQSMSKETCSLLVFIIELVK